MIAWRTIISGSAGPIFAIFYRMKAFLVQMIDLDLFFQYLNQFCEKKMVNSPLLSLWHLETELDIATSAFALTA